MMEPPCMVGKELLIRLISHAKGCPECSKFVDDLIGTIPKPIALKILLSIHK